MSTGQAVVFPKNDDTAGRTKESSGGAFSGAAWGGATETSLGSRAPWGVSRVPWGVSDASWPWFCDTSWRKRGPGRSLRRRGRSFLFHCQAVAFFARLPSVARRAENVARRALWQRPGVRLWAPRAAWATGRRVCVSLRFDTFVNALLSPSSPVSVITVGGDGSRNAHF